jgi:release factor glutamine methyltransferase
VPPALDTIAAALRWPGLDPVDARVLLQHALDVTHAHLIAHSERLLTEEEQAQVRILLQRRAAGEPVAYLVGRREFYGRDFVVTPAVLIPRPETELLVELALARMAPLPAARVLDLGTGSGCIAITLALERKSAWVVAVDVSAEALAVAHRNARRLGANGLSLLQGSWLEPVADRRFDLIVGNPPYVAEDDPHLGEGDLRFEPRAALSAGPEGLDAIAAIMRAAPRYLRPGGWLLLEHGWNQADAVEIMLERAGFGDRLCARDLAGHPRVSGGRKTT